MLWELLILLFIKGEAKHNFNGITYYYYDLFPGDIKLLYNKSSTSDANWTGYIRPVIFESNSNTSIDGYKMSSSRYANILICGKVEGEA